MAGERTAVGFYVDTNHFDDDQNIDAILVGQKWNTSSSNIITYSFIDSAADISYAIGVTFANEFSNTQKIAARKALYEIAKVADVQFEEIGDDPGEDNANGTLRFADYNGLGTAFGYYPNSTESGGDMAFSDGLFESAPLGSYEFATMMHEIGHAMGLKHGHEHTAGPGFPDVGDLDEDKDSMEYSIMTYNSHVGQDQRPPFYVNSSGHYAQTLMMYDIAALQRMYGPNWDHNGGDTVYTFDPATGQTYYNGVGQGVPAAAVIFRTEWDGGGNDTFDLSNFHTNLMIDLRPGMYSDFDVGGNQLRARLNAGWDSSGGFVGVSEQEYARGHVFNALLFEDNAQSLIENAIGGTGNDSIRGNDTHNNLKGNDGHDTLQGDGGMDTLQGDAGADVLKGGSGKDSQEGGNGNDTLLGNNGDDTLKGGNHNDSLLGQDGDDLLEGGAGRDTLYGGNNNDSILGGTENDKINGGDGRDTLKGGDHNDRILGGNDGDDISGEEGNDTLIGQNGEDTLRGGNGDDSLRGGNQDDTLRGDVGNDTIKGDYGDDFAVGGDNDDSIEGNKGDDTLEGNDGDDLLKGGGRHDSLLGGDGEDTLRGGAGKDTLEGGGHSDTLEGVSGNDTLTGGGGADTFLFNGSTRTGSDTVTDFNNGTDIIKITGGVEFSDLTIDQSGGDTVITWANGSVTLQGETGTIDEDDFMFG